MLRPEYNAGTHGITPKQLGLYCCHAMQCLMNTGCHYASLGSYLGNEVSLLTAM